MSRDKDDLFEEAFNMSLPKNLKDEPKEKESKNIPAEILQQAKAITVEGRKSKWDEMKDKINNGYTERAMDIMDGLPDREFLKVWLRMMEYVNPKITRKEILDNKEENRHIKITIEHHDKKENETKTIDIS